MSAFSELAKGKSVATQFTILPDTRSPGVAVSALFKFQSYFDDVLLEKALLIQSKNEPIVDSTLKQEQIAGYTVGLHPSSQTPIAFQPLVGGQPASPQAVILRPGQVYRPYGRPGDRSGNFSGFRWGLPFGWLGGGLATLYVLPSPDAKVYWAGDSTEVIFQRQRMQIADGGALPADAPKNWPLRFPWTQAFRGPTVISQQGQAIIAIANPTRIEMSLRLAALVAPADMRLIFQGTNDFDLDAAGNVIPTPCRFLDHTWGTYASIGAGNLGIQFPVNERNGEFARLAADDGGVQLASTDPVLIGQFVDVVRYGKL